VLDGELTPGQPTIWRRFAARRLAALDSQRHPRFLENRSAETDLESVAFAATVLAEVLRRSRGAQQKGLRWSSMATRRASVVIGDPVRFQQIVATWLHAIKFTEHGHVRVGVGRARARAARRCTSRTDTGIGVRRITGGGVRSFQQRRIDHAAVRRHRAWPDDFGHLGGVDGGASGGERPGVGSTFHFTIALDVAADQTWPHARRPALYWRGRPHTSRRRSPRGAMASRRRRLAPVEDNVVISVSPAACSLAGATTSPSPPNGAVALDRLEREHFDAVLMDVQMPVMAPRGDGRHSHAEQARAATFASRDDRVCDEGRPRALPWHPAWMGISPSRSSRNGCLPRLNNREPGAIRRRPRRDAGDHLRPGTC